MARKIKLTPEVATTYRYILQEFELIEKAMKPLKDHLAYLKEIGELEREEDKPTN